MVIVNTNSLKHLPLRDALSFIGGMGCSVAEVSTDGKTHGYCGLFDDGGRLDVVLDIASSGVKCNVLSGGWTDFTIGDTAQLKNQVGLARDVGVSKIRLFPNNPSDHRNYSSSDMLACVRNINWQAQLYRDVELLIENHGGYFGDSSNMLLMLLGVDRDNVGTVFDAGNYALTQRDSEVEAVEKLAKHIRHVHAKDIGLDGRQCPIGSGIVNWKYIIGALNDGGYTGDYSIEYEVDDPSAREAGLVESYNNLKELLV